MLKGPDFSLIHQYSWLCRPDVPAPVNHCFESSPLPGCTDAECLEAVCEDEPSCCDDAYTQLCLQTARQHADVCRPPSHGNTCEQTSPYGGCSHAECAELTCDIRSDCCNSDTTIGEWSKACVNIAHEACEG